MPVKRIVIDTNVIVAALRSRRGASFLLLSLVGLSRKFQVSLSIPLVLEYEDVLKRPITIPALSEHEIDAVLVYLCSVAERHTIFFLWRPYLKDPKDDTVLELSVEANCEAIVTFNVRDVAGCEKFGVRTVTPQDFQREIGEIE